MSHTFAPCKLPGGHFTPVMFHLSLSLFVYLSISLCLSPSPYPSPSPSPSFFPSSSSHSPLSPFHPPQDRKVFLSTWKEIPASSEVQSEIGTSSANADAIQKKLEANNVFTIARRTVNVGDTSQVSYLLYHIMVLHWWCVAPWPVYHFTLVRFLP